VPPIALTGDRHCAAADQRDHIEGEIVLVRTAFADPFDLGIDEARIERAEYLPAEPNRSIAPGAKFSTKTSARLARSLTRASLCRI
jgi:hypothetical protein